jgi:hypothetical protein
MADAQLKQKIYSVLKEGYFRDSPPDAFITHFDIDT